MTLGRTCEQVIRVHCKPLPWIKDFIQRHEDFTQAALIDYTPDQAANIVMVPEGCVYGTIRRDLNGDCACDLKGEKSSSAPE